MDVEGYLGRFEARPFDASGGAAGGMADAGSDGEHTRSKPLRARGSEGVPGFGIINR